MADAPPSLPPTAHSLPELLREPFARWWERAQSSEQLRAAIAQLSLEQRSELLRVVAGSEFAAATLIQDPQALNWFAQCEANASARSANDGYAGQVRGAPSAA